MNNNEAIVAKLGNIHPIVGADKIVLADVVFNGVPLAQVVTGVGTQEDTPIVYFDSNMCLSDKFCEDNPELKTYLAKGNRVRVVKLRGVISNGLAVAFDKIIPYSKSGNIPVSFTSIDGTEICHKYHPAPDMSARASKVGKAKNSKKPSRVIKDMFHFHIDTEQLVRNIDKVNPTDVISISRKWHGCSSIISNTLVKKPLSLVERVAKVLGAKVVETEWDYLYASRRIIKNADRPSDDLWSEVGHNEFGCKLHKGETVYYEIVGYFPNTTKMIQKDYNYGCPVGQYKIVVYRITQTNEDGVVVEHGWASMKERCAELGVPMVQEYYFGGAQYLFDIPVGNVPEWRQAFLQGLKDIYLEKDCTDNLGKAVPDEGIVLRVEAKDITVFKLKSAKFFLYESESASNGEVNTEEL